MTTHRLICVWSRTILFIMTWSINNTALLARLPVSPSPNRCSSILVTISDPRFDHSTPFATSSSISAATQTRHATSNLHHERIKSQILYAVQVTHMLRRRDTQQRLMHSNYTANNRNFYHTIPRCAQHSTKQDPHKQFQNKLRHIATNTYKYTHCSISTNTQPYHIPISHTICSQYSK